MRWEPKNNKWGIHLTQVGATYSMLGMEERVGHSGSVAGIDYPHSFEGLNRWFTDEAACHSFITIKADC